MILGQLIRRAHTLFMSHGHLQIGIVRDYKMSEILTVQLLGKLGLTISLSKSAINN
jgi:hypothetical protein